MAQFEDLTGPRASIEQWFAETAKRKQRGDVVTPTPPTTMPVVESFKCMVRPREVYSIGQSLFGFALGAGIDGVLAPECAELVQSFTIGPLDVAVCGTPLDPRSPVAGPRGR